MAMKVVSIILTTYNSANNLINTLRSIENQDYPAIEIIIKDGLSNDSTLDIIKKHEEASKYKVIWVSNKDTGIYDAMNRGYSLSSGEIITFFNDVYLDRTAVSKMVDAIESVNPLTGNEYVGAHADLVYVKSERIIRRWKMGDGTIENGWLPGHPTLFLRREIFEKYGLFDTSFKISADYEFMIRFLKKNQNKLFYLPETIVSMYYGGTSSGGLKSYLISLKEGHRALKKNGIKNAHIVDIRRTVRVLKQFLVINKGILKKRIC